MPASVEEIEEYLGGYDDQKYIIGVESSYYDNKVHLIIHDPEKGKRIEKHKLMLIREGRIAGIENKLLEILNNYFYKNLNS